MEKVVKILGIITIIAAILMIIAAPIVAIRSNLEIGHIIYLSLVTTAVGGFIISFIITMLQAIFEEYNE